MHETEKEETIEGNLLNGCAECSGQLLGIGIGDWGIVEHHNEYGKNPCTRVENIKTRNMEQCFKLSFS